VSDAVQSRPAGVTAAVLARNTGWNLAGQLLPLAVAAFALPVLARSLGNERFGVLSLVWALLTYLGDLGFGRATTKFAAAALGRGDRAALADAVWGTAAIQLATGLLLAAALALAAPLLARSVFHVPAEYAAETVVALRLLALGLPLVLLSTAVRGILEGAQRFDVVNWIRIPVTTATFLLPLLGAWAGWGLAGIVGLLVAGRIAGLLSFAYAAARIVPGIGRPALRLHGLGEMARFGGWVTVSTVVSPILTYGDRFILGALAGAAAVAYYTPPFELVTRLTFLPAALVAALFPAFSYLAGRADREAAERLLSHGVKLVLLVFAPILALLAVNAHDVLRLWLGAEFAQAGAVALVVLAAGTFANSLALIPHALLHGVGRADLTAAFHLIELPIYLVLAVLLVRQWGVTGAAVAWAARTTLDTVFLFAAAGHLSRGTGRALRAARVPQALALVALFAAAAAALAAVPALPSRALLLAFALAALVPAGWRWALLDADRDVILRLLRPGAAR